MSPEPIRQDAASIDLSPRVYQSAAIVASPTVDAEVIICSVTCDLDIASVEGVLVLGSAAFTVGTDGTAANLRIRKGTVAGTVVWASGAVDTGNIAAAELTAMHAQAFDTAPALPGQIYVLTLTVTAASAGSTVSAARLFALVV